MLYPYPQPDTDYGLYHYKEVCNFERAAHIKARKMGSSGWVSVEDRLPEEMVEVLCFPKYNEIPVQAYYRSGSWYGSGEVRDCMKDGYVNDAKFLDLDITHWQPLPSPPKEK